MSNTNRVFSGNLLNIFNSCLPEGFLNSKRFKHYEDFLQKPIDSNERQPIELEFSEFKKQYSAPTDQTLQEYESLWRKLRALGKFFDSKLPDPLSARGLTYISAICFEVFTLIEEVFAANEYFSKREAYLKKMSTWLSMIDKAYSTIKSVMSSSSKVFSSKKKAEVQDVEILVDATTENGDPTTVFELLDEVDKARVINKAPILNRKKKDWKDHTQGIKSLSKIATGVNRRENLEIDGPLGRMYRYRVDANEPLDEQLWSLRQIFYLLGRWSATQANTFYAVHRIFLIKKKPYSLLDEDLTIRHKMRQRYTVDLAAGEFLSRYCGCLDILLMWFWTWPAFCNQPRTDPVDLDRLPELPFQESDPIKRLAKVHKHDPLCTNFIWLCEPFVQPEKNNGMAWVDNPQRNIRDLELNCEKITLTTYGYNKQTIEPVNILYQLEVWVMQQIANPQITPLVDPQNSRHPRRRHPDLRQTLNFEN